MLCLVPMLCLGLCEQSAQTALWALCTVPGTTALVPSLEGLSLPTFCGVRWQQAEGRRVSSVREELLLLQPELRQGQGSQLSGQSWNGQSKPQPQRGWRAGAEEAEGLKSQRKEHACPASWKVLEGWQVFGAKSLKCKSKYCDAGSCKGFRSPDFLH